MGCQTSKAPAQPAKRKQNSNPRVANGPKNGSQRSVGRVSPYVPLRGDYGPPDAHSAHGSGATTSTDGGLGLSRDGRSPQGLQAHDAVTFSAEQVALQQWEDKVQVATS
eukprot:CAMPEP_0170300870 /NCGR_PEP_ID=MMETSP0116_2-20130129/50681_1 /TAXON_ID=400756 /ORGANISM="Durinskia baltica, Strain CSIRO CS-38" /LENGTH=108 /DNA_ID=CAMNT_0010552665 /DNA_START=82 /DNA_END=405 /DNA_ORIENTATION=+